MCNELNREKIVTNGCTGNCCASFKFPLNPEEIKDLIIARANGLTKWKDRFGTARSTAVNEDMEYIADMLIYLGETDRAPEDGRLVDKIFHEIQLNPEWYKDPDLLKSWTKALNGYGIDVRENGLLICHHYTCKYYDKENKICSAYENRPSICKMHGPKCAYIGCKFPDQYKEERRKRMEEFNQQNLDSALSLEEEKLISDALDKDMKKTEKEN